MSSFMGDNPETSREKSGPKAVKGPYREASERVESGVRQRECVRINESVRVRRNFVKGRDNEHVPKPGRFE